MNASQPEPRPEPRPEPAAPSPGASGTPAEPAAPSPAAGGTPADVPEFVDRLAAERGLGELAEVRADQSVRRALLQYWGMAVLGGLLLWVVGTVQDGVSVFSGLYSLLHAVVWFCFLVCLWGFVYGLRALILGSSAHYRYAQGLVFHRRSQLKAVTWQEVTRAKPVYGRKQQGAEGKVLGYELHTGEGLAFAVPLRLRNGKDTFVDAVLAQLQAHGCVVN